MCKLLLFTWIFASRRRTLSASIWEWTLKIHFAFVTTVICGGSLCVWGEATLENYVLFNISCLQLSMIKFVVLFALCFVLFKGPLSFATAGRKTQANPPVFPSNSFRFSTRTVCLLKLRLNAAAGGVNFILFTKLDQVYSRKSWKINKIISI